MITIKFFASCSPQPQGSSRAFVIGGKARITSTNTKLKPYRSEVAGCATVAVAEAQMSFPAFGKHVPVRIYVDFVLRKPASVAKKRDMPVVKPDVDKLLRATMDALTGIVWHDDAQVVSVVTTKRYGDVEGVNICAELE